MSKKRACMFCGRDEKLTSAHIISQSLQKLLAPHDFGTTRADFWVDELTQVSNLRRRDIDIHPANHQVKRLCHPCNGGWMGALEMETRSVLADLFHGRAVDIDEAMQSKLSTWATVACMLRSTQDPGQPNLDPEDVFFTRKTSTPPPGYHVWLVHGENLNDVSMRHYRAHDDGALGWLGWIWMGATILVVTSTVLAKYSSRRLALLPQAAVQLHPHAGSISWPPPNHVEPRAFIDLTTLAPWPGPRGA